MHGCVIICAIMMDYILPRMSLWGTMSKFLFKKQTIKKSIFFHKAVLL